MDRDPSTILNEIAQTIYDKKGFNILVLDVREISFLTDYAVVAEGAVDRHLIAIAHAVIENVKKKFQLSPLYVEGLTAGDWIVIDYFWIMIHLFMPGLREKYRLEELWRAGKVVDVKIQIEHLS